MKTLVPEVPGITVIVTEDLEPNPEGEYRRYSVIHGDFNRDGINDIAICGVDIWVKERIAQSERFAQSRNGYVLIASKSKSGTWRRVFFHKFPAVFAPFLIWNRRNNALVVGASSSDYDPGEIIWDKTQKRYKLVR